MSAVCHLSRKCLHNDAYVSLYKSERRLLAPAAKTYARGRPAPRKGSDLSGNDGERQTSSADTMNGVKKNTHRCPGAEIKQQVLAECTKPGASVANSALSTASTQALAHHKSKLQAVFVNSDVSAPSSDYEAWPAAIAQPFRWRSCGLRGLKGSAHRPQSPRGCRVEPQ